ncbi:hypothetical protein J6590_096028 [Homalodisca vitripennis]|nr:hypothetical protein J6590_096028 [Homalodisca vitripennis]
MLQFWKKTSKKEKTHQQSVNQNVNGVPLPVGVFLPTFSDSNLEGPLANFQHDGYTDTPPPHRSRLSITLSEVLHDRMALLYFSQFVELRGYSLLLNLWLDLQVLRGQSLNGAGDGVGERTCALRSVSDSVTPLTRQKVCQRYLTEDLVQRYRFPEDLCARFEATKQETADDPAFQQLQDFVYQTMRRELWHDFLRSEFFSKFQVEVLTSGGVTLSDILYHSAALNAFTEFQTFYTFFFVLREWDHTYRSAMFDRRCNNSHQLLRVMNRRCNDRHQYLG